MKKGILILTMLIASAIIPATTPCSTFITDCVGYGGDENEVQANS